MKSRIEETTPRAPDTLPGLYRHKESGAILMIDGAHPAPPIPGAAPAALYCGIVLAEGATVQWKIATTHPFSSLETLERFPGRVIVENDK